MRKGDTAELRAGRKRRWTQTLEERFRAKVEASGDCLLWTGSSAGSTVRYGRIRIDGKLVPAHRVAWFLATGDWPPPSLYCLHTCDVGLCVKFDHLFLGTQADNMRDARLKGRIVVPQSSVRARGERHGRARLTVARVRAIRRRFDRGESVADIARHFGHPWPTVDKIVKRKTWRHI